MKITELFVALLVLLSTAKVSAQVVFVAETGFIVSNQILVKANKEQTWQVFINQVDQWWPADHTWWGGHGKLRIDSVAGGCFCEQYAGKSAEHMRVVFVEPYKLLRMTGGLGPLQEMGMFGALDWTFAKVEQGTLVTMSYKVTGINPEGFVELAPIVDKVLALPLSGLAKLAQISSSH